ncbi:MAG: succinate dehydrogenase assembly factor 2 [Woeseia sp.]
MTGQTPGCEVKDSQLKWQCRRGILELDELLAGYLEQCYREASDAEKAVFRELLTLPNPELAGYLIAGREVADGVSARVISRIRNRTGAEEAAT